MVDVINAGQAKKLTDLRRRLDPNKLDYVMTLIRDAISKPNSNYSIVCLATYLDLPMRKFLEGIGYKIGEEYEALNSRWREINWKEGEG